MYTNSDQLLEALKAHVLSVSGIKSLAPADCKVLSVKIGQKTKQFLSETTLKRIYGFALSQFQPSLFTKNILAQYCDYEGWEAFGRSQQSDHNLQKLTSWEQLRQQTTTVSAFTLQALKHRSGIPYQFTISRHFINQHMADFDESGFTTTVICAPTGYGKTIALCHWIEDHTSPDHIYLLLNSTTLSGLFFSNNDLSSLMQNLLGCSTGINLDWIYNIQEVGKKRFYLVIDGFDEPMFKKEQFKLILHQLIDLTLIYEKHLVFKLVLTMRPDTWKNHLQHIDEAARHWYKPFTCNRFINVPLLSAPEIKKVSSLINSIADHPLTDETVKVLEQPLMLQFFYKHNKNNFSLTQINKTTRYELNSLYILNKVYIGHHATEKIILIKKLLAEMAVECKHYQVDKLKVNMVIKEYQQAYNELITNGVIYEFNDSTTYNFCTSIRFTSTEFLTYNLAKSLLYDNQNLFDKKLVKSINNTLKNSTLKLEVIKWCIIYAVKTGQRAAYAEIPELELDVNKKSELILFIGDLFKNELTLSTPNESLVDYFRQRAGDKLFDYFFGLEVINPDYKQLLNMLLLFDMPNNKKIMVYTALALVAVTNLDITELDTCIINLKRFDLSDHRLFAVSPLSCLEALHNYLKFGDGKPIALKELTRLMFHTPEDAFNKANCAVNDMLYILGLFTLLFAANPKKILRMVNKLNGFYKNVNEQDVLSPYRFFIQTISADCYFKLGEQDKVTAIYQDISDSYKKSENLLSPFMKMLFHCLKVKMLIKSTREEQIMHEMKCIDMLSEYSGSKFSVLYIMMLILKQENILSNHPNYIKQMAYDYKKLIRSSALADSLVLA